MVVAGAVLCALWFAFSRCGELVLGGGDEPAYPRGAWFDALRRGHGHRPGVLGRGGADLALREPATGRVTARSPEAVGAAMRYSFSGAFRGSRAIDCS